MYFVVKALQEYYLFHMLNPDDDTGAGYGTTKPKAYKTGMGHKEFPYGWEEESEWDWEKDEERQNKTAYQDAKELGFDDPDDVAKFTNKVGGAYISPDPAGRFSYDRKSFIDGETRGISGEATVRLLNRVIQETLLKEEGPYRLRRASSTPDSLGSDAWPGATPPKYPVRPERRKPRYTLKSVMLADEDQLDRYEGDGDPDDIEARFDSQE